MIIEDPYLRRLAEIESGGNPNAANPRSSARGLFQFMPATAQQYGLNDPLDPQASLGAAQRFTEDNRNALRQALGREPNVGELYLAHQQGAQGAIKLLSNPDSLASDIVGADAVSLNAGDPTMTSSQFANQWIDKFNSGYQEPEEEFIEVETPDGEVVEFPASMSDEEISNILRQQFPVEQVEEAVIEETPEQEAVESGNPLEGGLRSYLQGLTFGFGDELVAGLASLPTAALTDMSIPEAYNAALQGERTRQSEFSENNPLIDFGLQATGGIASGSGLASLARGVAPSAASAIGSFASRNPVTAGIGAGAGTGAAYGFGTGEGEEDRLQQAAVSGALGGLTGGVGGYIGGRIGRVEPEKLTSEGLRKEAGKYYDLAGRTGGILKPDVSNKFIDTVDKTILPQTVAGKKLAGNSESTKISKRLRTLRNKPITLQEAQEIDEFFGEAIDNFVDPLTGKVTKEGLKLQKAQNALRDTIENATDADIVGGKGGFEALKEGRKLWGRSAKLRDVERIIERANLMEQPSTGLKSGFRTLLSNPNRMRGFSKSEKKAIEKAAETGLTVDILRTFGSRLNPIITTSILAGGGGATGGPLGAGAGALASYGLTTGSRNLANSIQMRKANDLAQLIARGGPSSPAFNPAYSGAGGALGGLTAGQLVNE